MRTGVPSTQIKMYGLSSGDSVVHVSAGRRMWVPGHRLCHVPGGRPWCGHPLGPAWALVGKASRCLLLADPASGRRPVQVGPAIGVPHPQQTRAWAVPLRRLSWRPPAYSPLPHRRLSWWCSLGPSTWSASGRQAAAASTSASGEGCALPGSPSPSSVSPACPQGASPPASWPRAGHPPQEGGSGRVGSITSASRDPLRPRGDTLSPAA